MTKRLKMSPGVLKSGPLTMILDDGCLIISPEDGDGVWLDAKAWLALVAAVKVEDVPEPKTPGQRVHAAELRAGLRSVEWEHLGMSERAGYETTAGLLGITEGER